MRTSVSVLLSPVASGREEAGPVFLAPVVNEVTPSPTLPVRRQGMQDLSKFTKMRPRSDEAARVAEIEH